MNKVVNMNERLREGLSFPSSVTKISTKYLENEKAREKSVK